MAHRILILGGTAEAADLARRLAPEAGIDVLTSLAGRTRTPAALPGRVRIGGFGGAEGLAAFLEAERVDAVVDATHPFAAAMAGNAEAACRARPTPRLKLLRPAWTPVPGDRWTGVADFAEAAGVPPADARVFLAIGRQELGAFASRPDLWFLLRVVDPPAGPLPLARHAVVTGRGPFDPAQERDLLLHHRVGWVVAKNSGGEGGSAKLGAARALGLPVVLVRRPPPPPGPLAAGVDEAIAWVRRG